jgi:hypothetical protein
MELVLLQPNSPDWEWAWNWLSQHPINEGLSDPSVALHEGESWQYTGSWLQGERLISTFRHRFNPITLSVKSLSVSHPNFNPESITKRFKI